MVSGDSHIARIANQDKNQFRKYSQPWEGEKGYVHCSYMYVQTEVRHYVSKRSYHKKAIKTKTSLLWTIISDYLIKNKSHFRKAFDDKSCQNFHFYFLYFDHVLALIVL